MGRACDLGRCHALLESPGFRAADAPDEISSISRELVLELLSGMVEQPRSNYADLTLARTLALALTLDRIS